MRYDEELFSKVMDRECECPIECNMDEENIEYYLDESNEDYPYKISKIELEKKCILHDITLKDLEI